jgi:hypothetical protein
MNIIINGIILLEQSLKRGEGPAAMPPRGSPDNELRLHFRKQAVRAIEDLHGWAKPQVNSLEPLLILVRYTPSWRERHVDL